MRNLTELDRFRDREAEARLYGGNDEPHLQGVFVVNTHGTDLFVIAASGGGWDHVSVSTRHRCPSWEEMERLKRLFFRDDECAMQLHVPPAEHRNCHPYTLHIWRPLYEEIPRPPAIFVAPPLRRKA